MGLLEIAAGWAKAAGRRLVAVTVDHGLNPASPDWSRHCEAAARSLGVGWVERRWEGDKPATGLPAAARRARHALIAETARAAGARVVLMGHTLDDIAEADWMRDRGASIGRLREWAPSPVWPEGRGLMLLRPMLGEGRETLRAFLREAGRDWIEDPGNAGFGRGRARAALNPLPAGEGVRPAERSDAPSALSRETDRLTARGRSSPLPLGEGFLMRRAIGASDLAAVLLCASGGETPPRGEKLEVLIARLGLGEDFTATLAGARIEAEGAAVRVLREAGELRRRPVPDLALEPGVAAAWDGRYAITTNEPGWSVTAALGRLNALSKTDRAVAAGVPAAARGALPVLIRDAGTAPVLAWRGAEVRALAPRRLRLALGETTQESDLAGTMHGETPPPDLF